MTAPEVEVIQVEQRDVPIYQEWIGTLDGMINAEIKSQVTGYLLKQHYTEGAFVKKGQLLFELDSRPFEAALEQAKGDRAKALGQLEQANAQLLQALYAITDTPGTGLLQQMPAHIGGHDFSPLEAGRQLTQGRTGRQCY